MTFIQIYYWCKGNGACFPLVESDCLRERNGYVLANCYIMSLDYIYIQFDDKNCIFLDLLVNWYGIYSGSSWIFQSAWGSFLNNNVCMRLKWMRLKTFWWGILIIFCFLQREIKYIKNYRLSNWITLKFRIGCFFMYYTFRQLFNLSLCWNYIKHFYLQLTYLPV